MTTTKATKAGFWRHGSSHVGWSATMKPPSLVRRWGGAAWRFLGGGTRTPFRYGGPQAGPPPDRS